MKTPTPHQGASLSKKLLLLGALPAVVMFVALMAFFTSARLDDARTDLAQSTQMLADSLAPALEYAVVSGNILALEQVLKQSLRRSKAEWIRVTDVVDQELGFVSNSLADSTLRSQGFNLYQAEILQEPLELGSGTDWFNPGYGFSTGALRVGTVEVGVDPRVLAERQQDILLSSIAVGVAMLIFTILMVKHFLNNILQPIRKLASQVSMLIDGDYVEQPVVTRGNSKEIVAIQNQLNELAQHLAKLQASRNQTLAMSETAREKAELASHAKSEFLATMSHELRTPLNGVLGMVELIQEEPLTKRQRDYLGTARQATEDLLTVISDILDYARMDSGNLELENQEFDLRTLISNCAASYRHAAEQQGLALDVNFLSDWPENPMVIGDAPRVRQILAGLLGNSLKFTNNGFVSVRASWIPLESNCMMFTCSVSDTGTGIPGDRLTNIFHSFEQIDNSSSRAHTGTGLGLSLVQRLVELMGGHIQVESDVGEGSSFRFEVPFELPEQPGTCQAALPDAPREQLGSTAWALVVEDNAVNLKVSTTLLSKLGFQVESAHNGQEAIDKVKNKHEGYDVILMDCQMPVMDGYQATRVIREWEQSNGQSGAPIIALTADVSRETEELCLTSGMNDYVAKPVRRDTLREVLSRWIRL
ncbi:ATP-binding protein [Marinobacter halophilus]|uniref:histidine kinase n=1 Tax=Marinobacter halophilus TaxID=1323740 RepID=A0A2T1K827_9GAMM|nr:ATP-binding protein [Marinobacter halophilus]PSF06267.1 hybrid sensor histidine kinase/response regulator [Marinobacter halophilus]GGC71147.1 histidine kinase [Marinobacter halophilus]